MELMRKSPPPPHQFVFAGVKWSLPNLQTLLFPFSANGEVGGYPSDWTVLVHEFCKHSLTIQKRSNFILGRTAARLKASSVMNSLTYFPESRSPES